MAGKLVELTEEQREDFTRLAKALLTIEKNNKIVKAIGAKYVDFIDEYEAQLRRGAVVGDLALSLKISRKLIAEETI